MHTVSQINDSDPIPLADVRSSVQETIARLGFQPDLLLVHNPFVAEPGKLVELYVRLGILIFIPPFRVALWSLLTDLALTIDLLCNL